MTKTRKSLAHPPRSVWNSTLDAAAGEEAPTQAGEFDAGLEEGLGGGDKGIDAETGDGGYGGDAIEAGYQEAVSQPDRPLDAEIHGDPRTHADSFYPDEAKRLDPGQTPIGDELEEVIDEETAETHDRDEF